MNEEPVRHARTRHSWWPGWIWSLPVAAVLLLGWFLLRAFTQGGPEVTVVFPAIADLRVNNSLVTFESLKVGQVSSVKLEPDLRHLRVKLDLEPDLKGHLGKGTQFWIIGQSPSLANLSDAKAFLTGPSIGIKPAPGPSQDRYEGLAADPVLAFGAKGTTFSLRADTLGSVQARTPIYYRGERVGVVDSTAMSSPRGFVMEVFIGQEYAHLVHDGTRFLAGRPRTRFAGRGRTDGPVPVGGCTVPGRDLFRDTGQPGGWPGCGLRARIRAVRRRRRRPSCARPGGRCLPRHVCPRRRRACLPSMRR